MEPNPLTGIQPSAVPARKRHTAEGVLPWFSGWRALIPIQLIVLSFWNIDFAFFWKDDWVFMHNMIGMDMDYLVANYYGHIMPIFKIYYFFLLNLFGTSALAFSYVGKFLFACCGLALLALAMRITSKRMAWAMTIAFLIHPLAFEQVEWIFEQCISLHLLFQILSVYFFLRWVSSGTARDLWVMVLLTSLQNYSFGNGLFIPLLFVFGIFLLCPSGQRRRQGVSAFLLLFILFIAIQMVFGGPRATMPRSVAEIMGIFAGGFKLFTIDAARWFFIRENLLGHLTPVLGLAISLGLLALAFTRRDRDRKLAVFHALWFLFTFCSVPIVMGSKVLEREDVPYYYSTLCMIPVLFIAEHAIGGRRFWKHVPRPLLPALLTLLLGGVFLLDRELARMVSFRNYRNQQALLRSIKTNTPFHGFDDPAIYHPKLNIGIDDPVGVYRYWIGFNRFGSPFGYARDPRNWTIDTSILEEAPSPHGDGSSHPH